MILQLFIIQSVSSPTKIVKVIHFFGVFSVSVVRTRKSTNQQASVFFNKVDSDTKVELSDPELKCLSVDRNMFNDRAKQAEWTQKF